MQENEEKREKTAHTDAKRREKERVQFDFTPESLDRLDKLKEQIGASTRAEVVRQALRLFDWFVTEVEEEDTLTITDSNKEIVSTFKAKLLYRK
jgi:Ribbon-helix-helix protein, copG family